MAVHQVMCLPLSGSAGFDAFDFSGTVFVDTDYDDDLIGIVFGYQDFSHFYLVSWKARSEQYFQTDCWTVTATGLSVKVHVHRGNCIL